MFRNLTAKHVVLLLAAVVLGGIALNWFGLPWSTLLPLAIVVVCPLAMMLMMHGMDHQDSDSHSSHTNGHGLPR